MADNIRDIAFVDYQAGMSPAAIAEKYGLKPGTVRQWANRHWKGVTPVTEIVTPLRVTSVTKRTPAAAKNIDAIIANAVEENTELTPQQRDFCLYYTRNRNATQAYLKAYGCLYSTAMVQGHRLLGNPKIQTELARLRDIKNAALGGFCGDDVVELHMRIAFSDITDFVEFENKIVPALDAAGNPRLTFHPETGDATEIYRNVNEVRLRPSTAVDGSLLAEVSEGREGVKVKLADKQRSLTFLERWFELNPMDRHRKEYDNKRHTLEEKKHQSGASDDLIDDWLSDVIDDD